MTTIISRHYANVVTIDMMPGTGQRTESAKAKGKEATMLAVDRNSPYEDKEKLLWHIENKIVQALLHRLRMLDYGVDSAEYSAAYKRVSMLRVKQLAVKQLI